MRKLFALLACGLLAISIFGQNLSIQTFQKAVENAANPAEKIAASIRLSEQFRLAGQFAQATETAENAQLLAQKIGNSALLANSFDEQGHIFQAKFDYENAMRSFVEAMKLRDETADPISYSNSKNAIGCVFFQQGDHASALQNLEKALEIRQAQNDLAASAETNRAIGDVWLAKKIYGKAQEHFRAALDQKIGAEDINGAAEMASFLGKLSNELGDGDGALVYFRQSLDLNQANENLPRMTADFSNITEALIHQGNFDEANSTCQTAKKMAAQSKDTLRLAEAFKNEGLIFSKKGQKLAAFAALDSASLLLASQKGVPGTPEIYLQIATTFREAGNLEKAFTALAAYNSSRDAVFSSEKNRALLEMTTRFESEFAAAKQKQQIEKLEISQSASQKTKWFLLALLALGGVAVWSLMAANRLKKRDNELLKAKNDEIDTKNRELGEKNQSLDILNSKLVTEIAERENMERTTFARERFLARVSHEMRTPMNNILGLTRELLDNKPRAEQTESLRNLQFSANSLIVSINDMLDFSKIEAGKLTLETVEFDPSKIVHDVQTRFAPGLKQKKVSFKVEYDSQIPAKLVGDPARLNQILTNLVGASAKTTEHGEVLVQIGLQESSAKEATLKVSVFDTGAGLPGFELDRVMHPTADLEEIFDDSDGQNLGLAITRRLVDLQNGRIEARSAEGNGTSFMLWLPFGVPAKKTGGPVDLTSIFEKMQGKRVLLVEDNKINQLVVAKMLSKAGIQVTTADDGLLGLERFGEANFDLVLMDIQMPNMDGYRATAEMRKSTDPHKKSVPIIALTASAYLTDRDKAALFQMNDHIGKPFSPEELMEKVANCFAFA